MKDLKVNKSVSENGDFFSWPVKMFDDLVGHVVKLKVSHDKIFSFLQKLPNSRQEVALLILILLPHAMVY